MASCITWWMEIRRAIIDQDHVCQLSTSSMYAYTLQPICGGRTKHATDSSRKVMLHQVFISSIQHNTTRAARKTPTVRLYLVCIACSLSTIAGNINMNLLHTPLRQHRQHLARYLTLQKRHVTKIAACAQSNTHHGATRTCWMLDSFAVKRQTIYKNQDNNKQKIQQTNRRTDLIAPSPGGEAAGTFRCLRWRCWKNTSSATRWTSSCRRCWTCSVPPKAPHGPRCECDRYHPLPCLFLLPFCRPFRTLGPGGPSRPTWEGAIRPPTAGKERRKEGNKEGVDYEYSM